MRRVTLLLLVLVIFVGCNAEERVDQILEETTYSVFSAEGFSIEYPNWPATDSENTVDVSVSQGFCSVVVHAEEMVARQWYESYKESAENILVADDTELRVRHTQPYLEFDMVSDTRIYDCNEKAYAVSVVCISEVDARAQEVHQKVFDSASCVDAEQAYEEFSQGDFVVEYPSWQDFDDGADHELAATVGSCSVIVDRHNALPGDIATWMEMAMDEKDDHSLDEVWQDSDEYYLEYAFAYEDKEMDVEAKLTYCNYMTYMTQVLCIDDYLTPELEDVRDHVLDNVMCTAEYAIPTPEVVEEQKEEAVHEEPEKFEEIDLIVQTDIGWEYGVDAELVVFFVNNNQFFRNVLSDLPQINLVLEDDNNVELKIAIDDGYITLVDDGQWDDADVTLYMPLRDAVNILTNAANINPANLLSFALSVRTEPEGVKQTVIDRALRGGYNS